VQQSTDISCLPGPQQQTRRSGVRRPRDGTDRQTDGRQPRGLLPVSLLDEQMHDAGATSLPTTVNRQRRGCDLNPGATAPESSTLITRLPSVYECLVERSGALA